MIFKIQGGFTFMFQNLYKVGIYWLFSLQTNYSFSAKKYECCMLTFYERIHFALFNRV